jgi:hypothetical protein
MILGACRVIGQHLRFPSGVHQSMKLRIITRFVMAHVIVVSAQSPMAAQQSPEPITDADSYAIYAVLLPPTWGHSRASTEVMSLQQETATPKPLCSDSKGTVDAEWVAVERNFKAGIGRVRLLLKDLLKPDIPYRLVPRAEIAADDARLHRKYPGRWQHLPESEEIAYVSPVGFDTSKTRAMVYVGLRDQGGVYWLEKREGKWVKTPHGCYGAA